MVWISNRFYHIFAAHPDQLHRLRSSGFHVISASLSFLLYLPININVYEWIGYVENGLGQFQEASEDDFIEYVSYDKVPLNRLMYF